MSDLPNLLRDLASAKHDDLSVASEAADLIDQQAAEIADLKLRLNRWNSGDNSIGAKEQVKRLMAERDEWRRRAEQQRDFMKDTLVDEEYGDQWAWDYFVQLYPEAAQWFEEES